jgi:hypothetical protein
MIDARGAGRVDKRMTTCDGRDKQITGTAPSRVRVQHRVIQNEGECGTKFKVVQYECRQKYEGNGTRGNAHADDKVNTRSPGTDVG